MAKQANFNAVSNMPSALVVVSAPLLAMGLLLMLSWRPNDGTLFATALTADNYAKALVSGLFWTIMIRSAAIAAIVTASTIVLAYPVAYFIAFKGGPRRNLLLVLVTLPFWTSYLLRVFAWKVILGYNGVLNSAMVALGVPGAPFQALLYTPEAMTLTLAHAYAAFAILPLYVSLSAIEPRLLDAARDLGASNREIFKRIVFPLSLPGIFAAGVLVFIPTLGDYATPTLVGGPTSTMIGNLIQSQFGKANNWPYGTAIAVLAMVVVAALAAPLVSSAVKRARLQER